MKKIKLQGNGRTKSQYCNECHVTLVKIGFCLAKSPLLWLELVLNVGKGQGKCIV